VHSLRGHRRGEDAQLGGIADDSDPAQLAPR